MIQGKISIIVPVYNVEAYLEKCINSILNQTYKNLELILIDDGSSDSCPAICDEAAERDSRVKVIHKENAGVSSARNMGLDCAEGEYIGFVDSDDWIALDMYEQLLMTLQKYEVDCAMCEMVKYYSADRKKVQKFDIGQELVDSQYACSGMCISIGKQNFTNQKYFYLWDKIYKREVWDDIRFDESLKSAEDRWALFHVYRKVEKIAVCPKKLYYYRQNAGLSADCNRNRDFDYIVGYRMLEEVRKCGENTEPYVSTCVMHTLGRVRACGKNNDKDKYKEIHKDLKKIWKEVRKILKHAKMKYKVLTYFFRFSPQCLWFIMRRFY